MDKRRLGKLGEQIAGKYLESRGYRIMYTNWYCYAGEIDIVAYKDRLTFVEVKSAFSGLCSPCESFNFRKKKNLSRSINNFLNSNYQFSSDIPEWEADLICLSLDKGRLSLRHYFNVLEI